MVLKKIPDSSIALGDPCIIQHSADHGPARGVPITPNGLVLRPICNFVHSPQRYQPSGSNYGIASRKQFLEMPIRG
jgi:hypothetical protein